MLELLRCLRIARCLDFGRYGRLEQVSQRLHKQDTLGIEGSTSRWLSFHHRTPTFAKELESTNNWCCEMPQRDRERHEYHPCSGGQDSQSVAIHPHKRIKACELRIESDDRHRVLKKLAQGHHCFIWDTAVAHRFCTITEVNVASAAAA